MVQKTQKVCIGTLQTQNFSAIGSSLKFWFLTPASKNMLQIFFGTPFRFLKFITSIVNIRCELYQNLEPLRSLGKAPGTKNWRGGGFHPPLCKVGLRPKILHWQCSKDESYKCYLDQIPALLSCSLIQAQMFQMSESWDENYSRSLPISQ